MKNQKFCEVFLKFINQLDANVWFEIKTNYFSNYAALANDQTLLKHVSDLEKYLINQKLTNWTAYLDEVKRITNLFLKHHGNLPYFLFSSLLLRFFSSLVNYCEINLIFLSKYHEELVTYLRKETLDSNHN